MFCGAQLTENHRSNLQRRPVQDPKTLGARAGARPVGIQTATRAVAWQEVDESEVPGQRRGDRPHLHHCVRATSDRPIRRRPEQELRSFKSESEEKKPHDDDDGP